MVPPPELHEAAQSINYRTTHREANRPDHFQMKSRMDSLYESSVIGEKWKSEGWFRAQVSSLPAESGRRCMIGRLPVEAETVSYPPLLPFLQPLLLPGGRDRRAVEPFATGLSIPLQPWDDDRLQCILPHGRIADL